MNFEKALYQLRIFEVKFDIIRLFYQVQVHSM